MERAVRFLCAIVLVGGLAWRSTSAQRPDFVAHDYPEERANIEKMMERLAEACRELDLDRIDSFHVYGPQFTRVQDGRRMDAEEGRQAEREYFGSLDRFDSEFKDLKIDIFRETAVVTGIYEFEGVIGEESHSASILLTLVLVKVEDDWKITYEALSALQSKP